ncbi:hypothetical protein DPMN_005225 [Dreissena polymorpha]|uniref:Uncharacterized protein n=1 Tax=Dreissena polymorpha TaxID=45954 RepID=A0A9D4MPY3_DREPO|nr:hypothetical protein DPMN_005225 [Dreissena polymorpha]
MDTMSRTTHPPTPMPNAHTGHPNAHQPRQSQKLNTVEHELVKTSFDICKIDPPPPIKRSAHDFMYNPNKKLVIMNESGLTASGIRNPTVIFLFLSFVFLLMAGGRMRTHGSRPVSRCLHHLLKPVLMLREICT